MFNPYDDEEWRDIPGYPNYSISSFGRVWSVNCNRVLKPLISMGYEHVCLCNNAVCIRTKVHRLVAIAFIPHRFGANNVNHLDGDKRNNYFENLEWCTSSENNKHAYSTGLKIPFRKPVRIIETDEVFESLTACAKAINGNKENIWACLSGRNRTHHGFTFEYAD